MDEDSTTEDDDELIEVVFRLNHPPHQNDVNINGIVKTLTFKNSDANEDANKSSSSFERGKSDMDAERLRRRLSSQFTAFLAHNRVQVGGVIPSLNLGRATIPKSVRREAFNVIVFCNA